MGQDWPMLATAGSLRRCATPKPLLTVLREDHIGQAGFGVKLESLCKAKLHQEMMSLELGAGRKAEKERLRKFLSALGCIVSREWRTSETFHVLDASDFKRFNFFFFCGL